MTGARWERVVAFGVAALFLAAPARLLGMAPVGVRLVVIYGIAAPFVGILLARRHPRARFATYVFLTMDVIRCVRTASWPFLAADVALLALLQTPLLRRVFPRIDPARVAARWRGSAAPSPPSAEEQQQHDR